MAYLLGQRLRGDTGCEPLSQFYESGGGRRHFNVCCSNSLGSAGSEFHKTPLSPVWSLPASTSSPAHPRRPEAPCGSSGDTHPADQPCISGPLAPMVPQPCGRFLPACCLPGKSTSQVVNLPVPLPRCRASLVSAPEAHQASGHWQALPLFCPI